MQGRKEERYARTRIPALRGRCEKGDRSCEIGRGCNGELNAVGDSTANGS
jgi:hypothetical protein